MTKQLLPILAVVILLLGGVGLYVFMRETSAPSTLPERRGADDAVEGVMVEKEDTASVEGKLTEDDRVTLAKEETSVGHTSAVKTFEVEGENFAFSLKEIRVKKGDTVKILFKNEEGIHDFVIDEFDARTPQITEGKTAELTFVADKSGSFEYYCSVGQHRKIGMVGKLIVD